MSSTNPKSLSDYEIDDRAAEATVLLNHPLVGEALERMDNNAMATLLTEPAGSLKSIEAQVSLKVTRGIKNHLQHVINDQKLRRARQERQAQTRDK